MPSRSITTWAVLAIVLVAALTLRAIISRGAGWVDGVLGIIGGLAAAALFGGLAHLSGQPPDAVSWLLPTSESWTGLWMAVGAMIGDRIAAAATREGRAFLDDPVSFLNKWAPWINIGDRNGGDR